MSSLFHTHPLVNELRAQVAARGITQAQLAAEIGVSERTITYWMTRDVIPQRRFRPAIQRWLEETQAA